MREDKELLRRRPEDPAFRAQRAGGVDGAVLQSDAFVLRFFGPTMDVDDSGAGEGSQNQHRLLVVNFGPDLHLVPAPEPLLSPPVGQAWAVLWSSEDPRYGGRGAPSPEVDGGWHLTGRSAIVLASHVVDQER